MASERVQVGEVLALQRRDVTIDPAEDYRLIGVYSFGKGIFHRDPKSGSDLGSYRFFRIEPDDLVLSNIQAWEGAIGHAGATEAGTIGTHRFLTYAPVAGQINTNWARWFFLSEPGMDLVRRAAPGTAVRNRTLAIKRFEALEIPLPPIEVQIAASDYLDSIQRTARAASERLSLRRPSTLVETLPSLADGLIARAASGSTPVGELADFMSDTVHPGDDPAPAETFIGLQHIESHTGRRIGSDALGPSPMKGRKFRFRPGDVLYGYLRPYLNKVWVADRHGLCSVDQYVLRARPGTSPELLGHQLRGRALLDSTIELTHSLQLPRLRSGLLSALEVPRVPENATATLIEGLDVVRDQVVALAARRNDQLEVAKALIPAALNETFGPR